MLPFKKRSVVSEEVMVPRYCDVFEQMSYTSSSDLMPYPIGFRIRPPYIDPNGTEPYFVLLDSFMSFSGVYCSEDIRLRLTVVLPFLPRLPV